MVLSAQRWFSVGATVMITGGLLSACDSDDTGAHGDGGNACGGACGGSGGAASGGTSSGGTASGGAASGGTSSGGTASGGTSSGGAASGGTSSGGAAPMDGGQDASPFDGGGKDASVEGGSADSGPGTPLPHCPAPFPGGDVWNKTYDFGEFVPLVVGPNGRLYSGFYRGYAYSDDDGQTWSVGDVSSWLPAGRRWPYPAVSADGKSVWLHLPGYGTAVSRNSGRSFSPVAALSSLSAYDKGRVLVSPYHPDHILAYGSRQDVGGSLAGALYRSVDGGKTWSNLGAAIAAAGANGANGATFEPSSPEHFWIVDMPEGVLETTNGGGSFTLVPGSTHSFISTVARTFDGTDHRLLVTGACAAPTSAVIGTNAWQSSTGDPAHCCPWPIALPDPFNLEATVIMHCHDSDPANLRYSTNGGVSFTLATWPTSLDTGNFHVSSVHVDPFHPRTFYAMHPNAFTLLKSTDGGKNWAAVGWLPGHGC